MQTLLDRENIKEKQNTKEAEAWRNACEEYYEARDKYRKQKAKVNNFKLYNRLTPNKLVILTQYCLILKSLRRNMYRCKRVMRIKAFCAFRPQPKPFNQIESIIISKKDTSSVILALINALDQFKDHSPNDKLVLQIDNSRLTVVEKNGDANADKD